MNDRGAPTSMWQALPGHLEEEEAPSFDLATAEARLIVQRPTLPEVTLVIDKPEFLIGRAMEGVDLTLEDDLVSREHARLTVNERGYFRLDDLGSTNGIQYEGRRVKRLNLIDGDEFEIGEAKIRFHANMNRFQSPTPVREAPPRVDSVFADVDIPEPRPEPAPEPDEELGWNPEAARVQVPDEPPEPGEGE